MARAVLTVDADAAERRRKKAAQGREVRHWARPDGMGVIEATLDAEAPAIIDTALSLLADSARDAAARAGTPDQRTHQQRRADALTGIFSAILDGRPLPLHWSILPVTGPSPGPGDQPGREGAAPEAAVFSDPDLIPESFMRPAWPSADNPAERDAAQGQAVCELGVPIGVPAWWEPPALPTQQGRRPHLVVTLSAETLAGHDDLPGELSGHGAITAQAARDLARQAGSADLIILGQDANTPCHHPPDGDDGEAPGDPPGQPDPYRPSTDQVRDIVARHRICRAPGCTRRAELCDLDHVTPHGSGGRTCLCNLIPQCRHHHRLKTFAAWEPTLEPQENSPEAAPTVHWRSPTGREYTVPPPDLPGGSHW